MSINSVAVDRFMSIGKAIERVNSGYSGSAQRNEGSGSVEPNASPKYGYGSKPIRPDDFHKFGIAIKANDFHKMGSSAETALSVPTSDVAYPS
jgi:hypothetical protein